MSRYEWKDKYAPNIRYSIGYDAPMRTFFAQIHDEAADDDDNYCRLWLGGNFDEFPQLAPLLEKFGVEIPPSVLAELERDAGDGAAKRGRVIRVTFSRVYEYDAEEFSKDLDWCFQEATERAQQDLESDGEFGFLTGDGAFSSRVESIPIRSPFEKGDK